MFAKIAFFLHNLSNRQKISIFAENFVIKFTLAKCLQSAIQNDNNKTIYGI